MTDRRLRAALACPTLGRARRGYERFFSDLFRQLGSDLDLTLFKGGGERAPNEVVLPHAGWLSRMGRRLPGRLRYLLYQLEFGPFALALSRHLGRRSFDLVHFIDPPLARLLHTARRANGGRYRLLFTDAAPLLYDASRWVDQVHCLTPDAREAALGKGVDPAKVSMVPVGVDLARFRSSLAREELRRRARVPEDAFVTLAVTSLNRHHKRLDHLIEEVAGLEGPHLLWIDGSLHPDGDPSLLELASKRLGDRCRFTHLPSDRVGELYSLADVVVSASLHESFGMVLAEAMCCGRPVLAHDSPHFRWLIGSPEGLVDMAAPGALRDRLAKLSRERDRPPYVHAPEALRRFGWPALRPGYLELYRRTSGERSPGLRP